FQNGTFSFLPRFSTSIDDTNPPIYTVEVENEYTSGPYTYTWYLDGNIVEEFENQNQIEQEFSGNEVFHYTVVVGDGEYYSVVNFTIERLYIEFAIDENTDSVTASIKGAALAFIHLEDYTYQWYQLDASGV